MELEHAAGRVVTRDRAARFHRHAGMAPDREIELDHRMRRVKGGSEIAIVNRRRGSKPGFRPITRPKLRSNRPAPIKSIIESASSARTSAPRSRACEVVRTSLSSVWTSVPDARSAG